MIVIVDYGMGNLRSIENKLHRVGAKTEISSDPEKIRAAEKIILPGVGAFGWGMSNLTSHGLLPVLKEKVIDGSTPFLGICLGMQLLTEKGEEGDARGLGWIQGDTRRFSFGNGARKMRVPHIGWNTLSKVRASPLLESIPEEASFYFVHSYHIVSKEPEALVASTEYGYSFASVIQRGNIYGTQFHPEKSHAHGMRLLKNFAELA